MVELATMFRKKIFFILLISILFLEIYHIDSMFPISSYSEGNPSVLEEVFRNKKAVLDEKIKIVTVTYNKNSSTYLTRSKTPNQALLSLGYPVRSVNRILSTSPADRLHTDSHILIQTYRTELSSLTVEIPFKTETKGTVLCAKLAKPVVEQEGVLGVKTQTIEKYYLEDKFISERVISESIDKEPVDKIISYTGANHDPHSVTQLGHNCDYWNSVVDSLHATEEEKRWLKFTMRLESGCNAESNKSFYKGLFQWSPCLWYSLYPNDNIFDGYAQIRNTLNKVRAGAHPKNMWPAVYRKYLQQYPPLSWLPE
jgi:hypothetical protein